jgi:hypothetical protein
MMGDEDLNEKAFDKMQERLEEEHPGEWVLFHNGELVGTFKTREEAETAAHEKFGDEPHLIEEIQDDEDDDDDDYDDDDDGDGEDRDSDEDEEDDEKEKTGALGGV